MLKLSILFRVPSFQPFSLLLFFVSVFLNTTFDCTPSSNNGDSDSWDEDGDTEEDEMIPYPTMVPVSIPMMYYPPGTRPWPEYPGKHSPRKRRPERNRNVS